MVNPLSLWAQRSAARECTAVQAQLDARLAKACIALLPAQEALWWSYLRLLDQIHRSARRARILRHVDHNTLRFFSVLAGAGATIAGSSLAAQATGTWAQAIGVMAAVAGIAGVLNSALGLGAGYEKNLNRFYVFAGLERELEEYLVTLFIGTPLNEAHRDFVAFSRAYEKTEPAELQSMSRPVLKWDGDPGSAQET